MPADAMCGTMEAHDENVCCTQTAQTKESDREQNDEHEKERKKKQFVND